MTLVRLRVRELALPLRRPLRTAHGEVAQRSGWLVEIEHASGAVGFGEALPLPSFGGENHAACGRALRRIAAGCSGLASQAEVDPRDSGLGPELERVLVEAPVARGAVETAWLDALARSQGVSLRDWLGGDARCEAIPLNALLSSDTPAALELEASEALRAGFRTLKLKVAGRELEEDLAAVEAVRRVAGSDVALRLDANGGWSESEALRALRALESSRPEWLEQPIAPGDPVALARLRSASGVPIAADEGADTAVAVRALLAAEAIDAVVIKLPPLGGPAAAREIAQLASNAGKRVAVTSFLDSSLGIASALQLASALPGTTRAACGLATASLLAGDLAEPIRIEQGSARVPSGPGIGRAPTAEGIALRVGALHSEFIA